MFGVAFGILLTFLGAASMDSAEITIPVLMLAVGVVITWGSWELFVKNQWHE